MAYSLPIFNWPILQIFWTIGRVSFILGTRRFLKRLSSALICHVDGSLQWHRLQTKFRYFKWRFQLPSNQFELISLCSCATSVKKDFSSIKCLILNVCEQLALSCINMPTWDSDYVLCLFTIWTMGILVAPPDKRWKCMFTRQSGKTLHIALLSTVSIELISG